MSAVTYLYPVNKLSILLHKTEEKALWEVTRTENRLTLLSEAGDDKSKTKNGFKNSLAQRQIQKGSKPETPGANPPKLFTAVIYNFL